MMGVLMIVVLTSSRGRSAVLFGIVYGAMFVPLTYWLDRTKYRMDVKRRRPARCREEALAPVARVMAGAGPRREE